MSFYWFMGSAASSGGGSSSGDALMLAFGPLKISTTLSSVDGKLEIFIGDEVNVVVNLVDATNRPVNCDGDTMTALITDSDGATSVTPTVTALYDDLGLFQVSFDAPATAGNYQLTIRRNGGDGDIFTFGPLIIQVLAR
jgi:hypothetical protein